MAKGDKDRSGDEPEMLFRNVVLRKEDIVDEEERVIEVSFSSEEPVRRNPWFGDPYDEVLGHKTSEISLKRMKSSAPVYYDHNRRDPEQRLGVVQKAWLEDGKARAHIKFSKRNSKMDEYWRDIQDGILVNTSVGYTIQKTKTTRKADDNDPNSVSTVRAVRWTPHELSMVGIPADISVGKGRSMEDPESSRELETNQEREMKDGKAGKAGDVSESVDVDVDEIRASASTEGERKGTADALAGMEARNAQINELFAQFPEHGELRTSCLADVKLSIEDVRSMLLEKLGSKTEPGQPGDTTTSVRSGEQQEEKYVRGVSDVICVRSGLVERKDVDLTGNEFAGMSMLDMARSFLIRNNVSVAGMNKLDIVGAAFTLRAITHSSSDFGNILIDASRKSMLKGYDEAAETFATWTAPGNLSDFKIHNRVGLSSFGDLDEIPENGEYKYGTYKDRKATIQLATYGKMFSISRQAIINDDLDAFTKVPRGMGRAASRKVGDLAYALITGNPVMGDGTTLFHADHANLAGTPSAPTTTTVDDGRVAMALQTDDEGNKISIPPAYILSPVGLGGLFRELMTSQTRIEQSNSRRPNIVQGLAEVVEDRRLTTDSTTAWYLVANPNVYDTFEIGYLDGNPNPYMEQKDGWNVDGVEMKVRIDAAAAALDWRGAYKNAGA